MRTPIVYVDMDGVLANFTRAYQIHLGRQYSGWLNITDDDWAKLRAEWPTFWSDLEYEAHARELWAVVRPYQPILLTAAPAAWPTAAVGKRIWARRMLPGFDNSRIIVCSREDKRLYARTPQGMANILIDDLLQNIKEWRASGGVGVHYLPSSQSVQTVAKLLRLHFGRN